jgi:hypothetical protein
MNNFLERIKPIRKREERSLKEGLDAAGRKIKVGDTVAYGVSLGSSACVQIGEVVGFSEKGKPQIKIDERFRTTYGEKAVVTLQFFDRMVIISPIPKD